MFRCPASHHMSCCVGPHHWVATRGASYPPGPDASSHAVTFGAATWQHSSAAGWRICSCLTDCPRQHCGSSSLKAVTSRILTTGLSTLPTCVKCSCLCKIFLPVYVQNGSRYKASAALHLFATMCTGHSLLALSPGTVCAMPSAQSLVNASVSCITGASMMLISCQDTLGTCCFSQVRKQSFLLLDQGALL